MLFSQKRLRNNQRSILGRLKAPVAGFCVSVGITLSGLGILPAYSSEMFSAPSHGVPAEVVLEPSSSGSALVSSSIEQLSIIENGVYLYGQSPEADQLGLAYLVFEVFDNNVVGAFYMPNSSFDCFQGEFQVHRLSLQVTNSYEQTTFPYSIALNRQSEVATTGSISNPQLELAGFNHIHSVSENDYRILDICKTDQSIEL